MSHANLAIESPQSFNIDAAKWFTKAPKKTVYRGNSKAQLTPSPTDIPIQVEIAISKAFSSPTGGVSIMAKFQYPSDSETTTPLSSSPSKALIGKRTGRLKEIHSFLHIGKTESVDEVPLEQVTSHLTREMGKIGNKLPNSDKRKLRMELNNSLIRLVLQQIVDHEEGRSR